MIYMCNGRSETLEDVARLFWKSLYRSYDDHDRKCAFVVRTQTYVPLPHVLEWLVARTLPHDLALAATNQV